MKRRNKILLVLLFVVWVILDYNNYFLIDALDLPVSNGMTTKRIDEKYNTTTDGIFFLKVIPNYSILNHKDDRYFLKGVIPLNGVKYIVSFDIGDKIYHHSTYDWYTAFNSQEIPKGSAHFYVKSLMGDYEYVWPIIHEPNYKVKLIINEVYYDIFITELSIGQDVLHLNFDSQETIDEQTELLLKIIGEFLNINNQN